MLLCRPNADDVATFERYTCICARGPNSGTLHFVCRHPSLMPCKLPLDVALMPFACFNTLK